MSYTVTLMPGDGIGPEVSEAARRCIDATGVKIAWEIAHAGVDILEQAGTPLPDATVASVLKNKVALKGPVTTPIGTGFRSVNVALRHKCDLFACVRPCRSYDGVRSRYQNIDLVIVRENSEDLYAGIEFEKGTPGCAAVIDAVEKAGGKKIKPDSGVSIKPISVSATRRVAKYAFDYARQYQRKKVTAIAKANIMKFTDGLFYATAREVAKEYADIKYEEVLVDAMCMQLVQKPELYDVLLLPNLYGDIMSDLCAGLVGGLGVAPGANIGDGVALFEAVHGSAPKYKGQNKVNPTAVILSGVLMLRWLGETAAAEKLDRAVADVIRAGKDVTYDMKADRNDPSAVGTSQMADAIIRRMQG
ncbi:MAG: isocitrate/isopropylmalate dehydrogenase family protein [Planctomycetes bacterium]|nr:isocitrate/isopropylmalate dehydrogenase family protein [Planctomycetota bacterium]